MGFPRQRYWSGLPCPSPGDLPHPATDIPPVGGLPFTLCVTFHLMPGTVEETELRFSPQGVHNHRGQRDEVNSYLLFPMYLTTYHIHARKVERQRHRPCPREVHSKVNEKVMHSKMQSNDSTQDRNHTALVAEFSSLYVILRAAQSAVYTHGWGMLQYHLHL